MAQGIAFSGRVFHEAQQLYSEGVYLRAGIDGDAAVASAVDLSAVRASDRDVFADCGMASAHWFPAFRTNLVGAFTAHVTLPVFLFNT